MMCILRAPSFSLVPGPQTFRTGPDHSRISSSPAMVTMGTKFPARLAAISISRLKLSQSPVEAF